MAEALPYAHVVRAEAASPAPVGATHFVSGCRFDLALAAVDPDPPSCRRPAAGLLEDRSHPRPRPDVSPSPRPKPRARLALNQQDAAQASRRLARLLRAAPQTRDPLRAPRTATSLPHRRARAVAQRERSPGGFGSTQRSVFGLRRGSRWYVDDTAHRARVATERHALPSRNFPTQDAVPAIDQLCPTCRPRVKCA